MTLTEIKDMVFMIQMSNDPLVSFSKWSIFFILMFIAVRFLLIGNLFKRSARIDRDTHKAVRAEYFRLCWIGWLLFLVGVGIFHLLTMQPNLLLRFAGFDIWVLIVGMCLFAGIFYHLYSFARAVLIIFTKRIEVEKN